MGGWRRERVGVGANVGVADRSGSMIFALIIFQRSQERAEKSLKFRSFGAGGGQGLRDGEDSVDGGGKRGGASLLTPVPDSLTLFPSSSPEPIHLLRSWTSGQLF